MIIGWFIGTALITLVVSAEFGPFVGLAVFLAGLVLGAIVERVYGKKR
jgi:hypothetical protein